MSSCTHAYLTDSSSNGYALLETDGKGSEFADVIRYREKWRFRQTMTKNSEHPTEATTGFDAGYLDGFASGFDHCLDDVVADG